MSSSHALMLLLVAVAAGSALAQGAAPVPEGDDETTGRMLYTTQCSGCHRVEIHWRDRRIARDWATLLQEVRRWQRNSGLAWSDDEILAVARYLNATWYRFPSEGGKELAARDRGQR